MARSMHRVIAAPANDFGKLADADPGRAATHDALGSEPSAHIAADVLAIAQGVADTQADLEILRNGVSDIAETLENKISDNGEICGILFRRPERPLDPHEGTEDRTKNRSERKGARRKGSSRRKSRQSTSISSRRHAGVDRARRCRSSAWQKRHMQQSTLIGLSRRSKQRSISRAERAKRARRSGPRGRLASLVKNRQSKEHEENRSESPFSRWRDLTQVRTWSGPGKR